jgi:hypothetical protein
MSVQSQLLEYLVKNDIDNQYQTAINQLSKKYSFLDNYSNKTSSKVDIEVLQSVEIFANICNDIETIKVAGFSKEKEKEPELDFYSKAVLKSLKVAQVALLGLLPKSPWKVGIAYNALHFIIKYVEKDLKKKALEKQKKGI